MSLAIIAVVAAAPTCISPAALSEHDDAYAQVPRCRSVPTSPARQRDRGARQQLVHRGATLFRLDDAPFRITSATPQRTWPTRGCKSSRSSRLSQRQGRVARCEILRLAQQQYDRRRRSHIRHRVAGAVRSGRPLHSMARQQCQHSAANRRGTRQFRRDPTLTGRQSWSGRRRPHYRCAVNYS